MRFIRACVIVLAPLFASASALAAPEDEVMQERLETLEERVRELEAEKAAGAAESTPPVQAPPPVAAAAEEGAVPPSPTQRAEQEIRKGRQAKVIYRKPMNDNQYAASRAGDYTVDPDFRGFIPIPNTVVLVKFNARPRVDLVGDTGDPGTEFRFVPAKFPVTNDEGWQMGMNANGSQLVVDVEAPSVVGTPRFYYQSDFFGSNDDPMRYRLQHLYGEYQNVLAGFTFGVFEDPDAWPDTVDYEGTNSVVFARRALVQYTHSFMEGLDLTLSVEDPDQYIDLTPATEGNQRSRVPDSGFALRWGSEEWGHVRFATIFRSISSETDNALGGNEDVFGWGINASGSIGVWGDDTVQFWFVYGKGVGGMGNDTSFVNSDAAFSAGGHLRALEYRSTMIALTHHWSPRWRSTLTHGYVDLENLSGQAPDAYNKSQYASANLVMQVFERLQVGLEGLYGFRQVNDGRDTENFRVQLGLSWKLFN